MNASVDRPRYRSEKRSRQNIFLVSEESPCYCSSGREVERKLDAIVTDTGASGGAPTFTISKRDCLPELLESFCTTFGMEVYRSGKETAHGVLFESCDGVRSIGYVRARDEYFYCDHGLVDLPLTSDSKSCLEPLRSQMHEVVCRLLGDDRGLFAMTRTGEYWYREGEENPRIKNLELVFCRRLPEGLVSDGTARVDIQVRGDSRIALATLRHPLLHKGSRCDIRSADDIMDELSTRTSALDPSRHPVIGGMHRIRDINQTYRRSLHHQSVLVPYASFLLSYQAADGTVVGRYEHVPMAGDPRYRN